MPSQNARSVATPVGGSTLLTDRFDPLVPVFGCCVLGVVCWLYVDHIAWYHQLMDVWFDVPFEYPFLDLQFVTAGIDCWSQGVDVYAHNPCDPLGRVHNYSPLWLRFAFLPTRIAWLNWLGLGLLVTFMIALGFLPRLRRPADRVFFVMAVLSSSSVFLFERGNLDLLMFVFVVIAGSCLGGRRSARFAGYGFILLAGLLKFYPLALFILLLREKRNVFFWSVAIVTVALAGFVFVFHDELPRMAANMPVSFPAGMGWGAKSLPRGLNDVSPAALSALGYHAGWVDSLPDTHLMAYSLLLVLLIACLTCALHLAHRTDMASSLVLLPANANRFLTIGAALTCGCFFSGQSLPYRAIYLLFVLPGLLILAQASAQVTVSRIFRLTAAAVLFLLWQTPIRRIIAAIFGGSYFPVEGPVVNYVAWIILEVTWWWVITVLMSILLLFLASLKSRQPQPPANNFELNAVIFNSVGARIGTRNTSEQSARGWRQET